MKSSVVLIASASFIVSGCLPQSTPSGGIACPYNTGSEAISPQNGLVGSLYYLNSSQPRYTQVEDYIQHGTEDPATLYFNQLDVPTRDYLQGYPTQNGSALTTSAGNPLYEYFALRFESQIRLAPGDQSGRYQFAILSDDGSIMNINQSGQSGQFGNQFGSSGLQQLINNDGVTESRLECANQGINFDATTSLPVQIDYFQGPRYNLSLMLLWREVPETSCGNGPNGDQDEYQNLYDVACGEAGNDTFFDWQNNPATPTPLWLKMLNRGWKVVGPENFFLPASTEPCTSASPSPSPTPSASGPVSCASGSGESSSQGLLATLKSFPGAESWGNSLGCGSFKEVPSVTDRIYFSDVDVPAQSASEGFPGPDGPLKDSSGDILIQNFSLTFTGEIKLTSSQDSGFYQFATLSDDGSVLNLDTGSGLAPSVNNDYRHGSTLQGSTKTVYMDQTSLIPMQLQYFQGNNPQMALILMMKKTTGPQCGSNSLFGVQSNFFDCSQSPSKPEAPYESLLSQGWVVLTPDNYQLPAAAIPNPCIGGPGPSPSPSPSPSASPSPSPSASPSPTHSATPSPSPSPSPSPTVSVTPSPSPSPSPTVSATPSPSPSPSPTVSVTPSPSPSATGAASPGPSPSVTSTPSPSPTVSATPTPSPSQSSCAGSSCGGGAIGI